MKHSRKIFLPVCIALRSKAGRFSFLIITGLFLSLNASAVLVPCGREGTADCNLCHFWQLAVNIINFLTWNIAVPLAGLLFFAAGVVFLVSGGNDKRIETAKKIFTNTVLGIFLVFVSWLLINTLIQTIVNRSTAAGEVVWAWNTFPGCPASP